MFEPLVDSDVHLGREASHVGLILEHVPDLTVQAIGRAIQNRQVSSFPGGSLPAGQVVTHRLLDQTGPGTDERDDGSASHQKYCLQSKARRKYTDVDVFRSGAGAPAGARIVIFVGLSKAAPIWISTAAACVVA